MLAAAWERGSAIAGNLVAKHRAETGEFPETVGVMLWGLDAIKTRGESVAIALSLVGARPVKEGTGRVVRFELVPLAELGRPRIDVLANMSGIFRYWNQTHAPAPLTPKSPSLFVLPSFLQTSPS